MQPRMTTGYSDPNEVNHLVLPPVGNPTTSFLTATTLIYAAGAGITAAAGTRLALQLFVTYSFTIGSFPSTNYES